jgi:intein/homing endonuclease
MVAVTSLKYPKKSHRKLVKFPEPSAMFAEFIGIMIGDGGINNEWQANITLNSIADKSYAEYVTALCVKLFNLVPAVRKRKAKNALVIVLTSTSVVDFLVSRGLRRGNKLAQSLDIPEWVLANRHYQRSCVRGLIDTDGCLYIHKHKVAGKYYKNIGLCFTSASPRLIGQVATIFEEWGIVPHINAGGKNINLYSVKAVERYLRIFGTSNMRISSVFKKWKGG